MTDAIRHFGPKREVVDKTGVFRWRNTSGETVPAFGCIKLSEYNSEGDYFNAVKPDGDGNLHFFNGPIPVAANAYGEARIWGAASVLGKTTAAFGKVVGPVADSWDMTTNGTGFVVFSEPSGGIAAILKEGGGGSESGHIWFEIESVICNDDNSKTLFVTPTWFSGGCDKEIPGTDEYGQLAVEDPCSILEYYTAEWLESGGVVGRATYMFPRDASYCDAKWLVDQICGQPECA